MDKQHEKHAKLNKPLLGEYNRNELSILGTTCTKILQLANQITQSLAHQYSIAFVDADHKASVVNEDAALAKGATLEAVDKISFRSLNYQQQFNAFQNRQLFNQQDLVLVNGNHFLAQAQLVVIDPAKPLEKKLDRLTNVKLVLFTEGITHVPEYFEQMPGLADVPVKRLDDVAGIVEFVKAFLTERRVPLFGLVLAGGKSERMQADKGSLNYHGQTQRQYMYHMLNAHCEQVYISYADEQAVQHQEGLPVLMDTFTGLGPYGGILSAFRTNTNAAWLTVACDLPYLSAQTIEYLVLHRNPSKTATAFMDSDSRFPEPLITIWEPRAYPVLLQFLGQGYSCPRKVLINSDVELLQVPDVQAIQNVNYPEQRDAAMQYFNAQK